MASGIKLEQDDGSFVLETTRLASKRGQTQSVIQRNVNSTSYSGKGLSSAEESVEMDGLERLSSDSEFPTSPGEDTKGSGKSKDGEGAGKGGGKLDKSNPDYLKRRERNNIAVKKSRIKAKQKIEETQKRVELLTKENEDLRGKVQLLSKELTVLRSLFANGGLTVPTIEVNGNATSGPSQVVTFVPTNLNGSNSLQTDNNTNQD